MASTVVIDKAASDPHGPIWQMSRDRTWACDGRIFLTLFAIFSLCAALHGDHVVKSSSEISGGNQPMVGYFIRRWRTMLNC